MTNLLPSSDWSELRIHFENDSPLRTDQIGSLLQAISSLHYAAIGLPTHELDYLAAQALGAAVPDDLFFELSPWIASISNEHSFTIIAIVVGGVSKAVTKVFKDATQGVLNIALARKANAEARAADAEARKFDAEAGLIDAQRELLLSQAEEVRRRAVEVASISVSSGVTAAVDESAALLGNEKEVERARRDLSVIVGVLTAPNVRVLTIRGDDGETSIDLSQAS